MPRPRRGRGVALPFAQQAALNQKAIDDRVYPTVQRRRLKGVVYQESVEVDRRRMRGVVYHPSASGYYISDEEMRAAQRAPSQLETHTRRVAEAYANACCTPCGPVLPLPQRKIPY